MSNDTFEQKNISTGENGENTASQVQENTPEDLPTKPNIIIKVTRDNLEVEMQFQRTGVNTLDPVFEDVMAKLAESNIVYGVNQDNLRHLCQKPSYNHVFVVGKGKSPQTGNDGHINYLVKTTKDMRPKIKEDGTADFKDLGLVQNAQKGQVLCEVIHPQKGEDGCDVYGTLLPGKFGKDAPPCAGANTEFNQDNTQLLAATAGNVEVKHGIVSIVEVLKINGNVDNSTGDINFVGDIIIAGDVISGFKVQSGGSITVKGSVEGATLYANQDINISEGVNGMDRASLTAQGSIKCKYIQSSFIKTGKNIYADTLMYCSTECSGDVELTGKRGALIGGRSTISGKLIARTIGTTSHTTTNINMSATGLSKNNEAIELANKTKQLDGEITKMVQIMTRFDEISKKVALNPEQIKTVMSVKENYLHLSQIRKETFEKLEGVKNEQLEASRENSYIECKDRVHTGVRIAFGPLVMQVADSFVNSRIHIIDGEIKISTL